jgi:hypothetical protein
VESALVLGVFALLILGLLDRGLMAFQNNVLSEAARRVAREAIVRGSLAEPAEVWGPATYDAAASDGTAMAATLRNWLFNIDPDGARLRIEWPDGTNEPDSRVRVTVTYRYEPVVPLLAGSAVDLVAESTMRVAH